MNEIVIKSIECIAQKEQCIAQCIIVTGKILQGTKWYLKHNPKLTIQCKDRINTENIERENYLVDCIIDKPSFDMYIFNKPTSWLNKS